MSSHHVLKSGRNQYIVKVTLGYAVFALLWIFLSDQLLAAFTDISQMLWLSTAKGIAFVIVTGLLLFFALRFVPAGEHTQFSLDSILVEPETPLRWPRWGAYLFAVAISLVVLWIRDALSVSPSVRPQMTIFMFPIILSAAVGGAGPGLLATGIAVLGAGYHAFFPLRGMQVAGPYDLLQLSFLAGNGMLVSVLSGVLHRALRRIESAQRLQAVTLACAADAIITTDKLGRVTLLNAAAERLTGWPRQEATGQSLSAILDLVDETHFQPVADPVQKVLAAATTVTFEQDAVLRRSDGTRYFINMTGAPIQLADGATLGVILTFRDDTGRKQMENALRQAATVFESTQEGVIITDADVNIVSVNRAFTRLTGYSEAEMLGKKPSILRSGRNSKARYTAMWAEINTTGYWQGELWNRRKNGEIFPVLISINAVKDESGTVINYVSVFMDISTLKASEEQLEFLAHHDALTQLPNRRLLFSQLEHDLAKIRRDGGALGLLMFDLDRFKDVNDSLGHLAGDQLLQQVARRLSERLRRSDAIARLGGDEFTVLLDNLSRPEDAARVAGEIIDALKEPFHLPNNVDVRTSASIGISFSSGEGTTAESLLQQADSAMYRAKAEGRGRFQYFSESMTVAARERIDLDSRLRRALLANEFRVYYQPLVEIRSGHIIGAEALVRWLDPGEGLIPPSRFIPVAEETGMIREIGEWVLRETCRQGRQWQDAGLPPLILAVNVSARQVRHGNLVDIVDRILAETGLAPRLLELELTESALMEEKDGVAALLNELRSRQIRLAIDDFGTGYSSLAYLKRFPLDVLKIDKSFIDDISHDQDDRQIIKAIIEMGHTLGIKVLAEGVESAEQLAFLQEQGCDLYQGYYRSPPIPADEFERFLANSAGPAGRLF